MSYASSYATFTLPHSSVRRFEPFLTRYPHQGRSSVRGKTTWFFNRRRVSFTKQEQEEHRYYADREPCHEEQLEIHWITRETYCSSSFLLCLLCLRGEQALPLHHPTNVLTS